MTPEGVKGVNRQRLTQADIQDPNRKPTWVGKIENIPAFMNTIQAILRWREEGVGNTPSRTMTPGLTQAQKRVWARLKAEQWIRLERQLHGLASAGAPIASVESAQVSVYSHAAQLLLPYIDDSEAFGAIVEAVLEQTQDHPLPEPCTCLVPISRLWSDSSP
jgi:hypothetical protein